jgi:hypothetical protein
MNTCLKWNQTTLTTLLLSNARIGYYKSPKRRSVGKWCLPPTGLKRKNLCAVALTLRLHSTLSVFSWVVDRWRWKKTFLQPPSAPEWIKDLILALIDRFGDRENELS